MSDLKTLFTEILAQGRMADYPAGGPGDPTAIFGRFLKTVREAPETKIICKVETEEELTRLSATALILADSVIVTGIGQKAAQMVLLGPKAASVPVQVPSTLSDTPINFGTIGFPKDVIDRWCEDAREFIVRGRLLYIPERIAIWKEKTLEDGRSQYNAESLGFDAQGRWILRGLGAQVDATVLTISNPEEPDVKDAFLEATSVAVPVLECISLRTLCEIMEDEEEAYICFRAAFHQGLGDYLKCLPPGSSASDVRAAGARFRNDVLEPAAAQLTRRSKSLIRIRSLRIAGAALSTAALGITAVTAGGLVAGLSAISTSATGKAFLEEVAGLHGDLATLRENPWYFDLVLKRRAAM